MDDNQVKMIIQLRKYVINAFNSVQEKSEPSALMKQSEVAVTLSTIIQSMDDILKTTGKIKFD